MPGIADGKGSRVSHTPGPWTASPPVRGDEWWFGSGMEQQVRDHNGNIVCVYSADTPEQLANMRLIAAAPDLLAAAKFALAGVQQMGSDWSYEAGDRLSAAIDKAEPDDDTALHVPDVGGEG